ncbi:glycosyltransferase family 4 protein [Haloarcula sp. Atlit-7R]|uniref:glycosyltransferase family 4 protein n=1 Tax=Haloarcula sp. Atlit-7R TaxID=2282125 RepID=UPI000EF13844|nr:glycosyltransferase family 4 protein [Haloarcula sp. Atlit-7R]RLM95884.1 glycosyltransferase family 1 protein [Haloarcula sp. Atlit-7R]
MHIGFISPRYPPSVVGGGEISLQLLAENLAKQNWVDSVQVFTIDGNAVEHRNGVKIYRVAEIDSGIKEITNIRALYNFSSYLNDIKQLDILHSYNMKLHPVAGYLSKRYDIPSVATLNSYEYITEKLSAQYDNPIKLAYRYVSLSLLKALTLSWRDDIDQLVALSESVKSIYADSGFPMEKIVVIPNMIDPDIAAEHSTEHGDGTTLLYAGAIKKPKGVDYLIKALTFLPEDVSLRVAGTGDQLEEIKKLVAALNLKNRVEFTGWLDHDEMPDFYASGDIFVHPSVWPEPFGRTLLEAMQHSLPVVATRTGGSPEVIPQTELLCRSESPAALAIAIQNAIMNETKYRKENNEYVNKLYHPKKVIPKYKSLYEQIM